MNCIDLFRNSALQDPNRPALWMPPDQVTTFGQLHQASAAAQELCMRSDIKKGDGVLLFDKISPRLYAAIIGIMGLGAHAILVEPWMPLSLINRAISLVKPKMFLTGILGRAWGWRARAIRDIPAWCGFKDILNNRSGELIVEAVSPETLGMVTFTTGTTGSPKGVVRTHGLLVEQHFTLSEALRSKDYAGADLTVFANLALSNLANGRCSLLVPPKPNHQFFQGLTHLTGSFIPVSLTCGPAFLKRIIEEGPLTSLQSVNIGGALTDCALFEKGFRLIPEAHWLHVYGSSEAEPVACCDARQAVAKSKKHGYFQTLYFGHPVPEIQADLEKDTSWVCGSHVSPFYLGDSESNKRHKHQDDAGRIWHDMGDRILLSDGGWWYGGRSIQPRDEFFLEQKIYTYLQSSACFVQKDQDGQLHLLGENVYQQRKALLQQFSELADVFEIVIFRDPRHRSRIDRHLSIMKGAPWIVG